jgi:hypothetical protein
MFETSAPLPFEQARPAHTELVELIGNDLRVGGSIDLGGFGRLSDYVSLQSGTVHLHEAMILNRRGMPTADSLPEMVIQLHDLAVIGQRVALRPAPVLADIRVEKIPRRIMAVTAAHIVEGTVSLYPGAELMTYLQATDPPFLPLLNARLRWLSDRRLKTSFEFALLNRAQIVAVAPLD